LRDVLRDSHDAHDERAVERKRPVALFGEFDGSRVETLLAALRETLAAAFPSDAVTSRHEMQGAAPITHLLAPHAMPPGAALDLASPKLRTRPPSLEAAIDLGCSASVSVLRVPAITAAPYDHRERRLFVAIVALALAL
jgi:hypothetical protein